MSKFKQFERYSTRNGGTALILGWQGDESIMRAAHYDGQTLQGVHTHYPTGQHGDRDDLDILPPEPEKRVCWVNVYQSGDGKPLFASREYKSRGEAAMMRDTRPEVTCVGCHRITLRAEFEAE